MRLKLKLINNYPYVKTTEFCFLSSPELKFTLKPLLPINVMDIPLLQEFIANLVKSSLAWYIAPNTYSVDVEEMMKVDKTDKGNLISYKYSRNRNCKNNYQTSQRSS